MNQQELYDKFNEYVKEPRTMNFFEFLNKTEEEIIHLLNKYERMMYEDCLGISSDAEKWLIDSAIVQTCVDNIIDNHDNPIFIDLVVNGHEYILEKCNKILNTSFITNSGSSYDRQKYLLELAITNKQEKIIKFFVLKQKMTHDAIYDCKLNNHEIDKLKFIDEIYEYITKNKCVESYFSYLQYYGRINNEVTIYNYDYSNKSLLSFLFSYHYIHSKEETYNHILLLLTKNKADPITAIYYACSKCYLPYLQLLIDHNVNLEHEVHYDTYLELIIKSHVYPDNMEKAMTLLIKHGYDINTVNALGNTIVHCLSDKDPYGLLDFLFQYKLNLKIRNKYKMTPLDIAVNEGQENNVYKLLNYDPTIIEQNCLDFISKNTTLPIVQKLVESGVVVTDEVIKKYMETMYKYSKDHWNILEYLQSRYVAKANTCDQKNTDEKLLENYMKNMNINSKRNWTTLSMLKDNYFRARHTRSYCTWNRRVVLPVKIPKINYVRIGLNILKKL